MCLTLSQLHVDQMRNHVQSCLPEEGCGLLIGKNLQTRHVLPIENINHSHTSYRMKATEQIKAMLHIEMNEWELLAIFHSHPEGPEHPSQRDIIENNYPGVIHLIWHLSKDEWYIKAFRIENEHYCEIRLKFS